MKSYFNFFTLAAVLLIASTSMAEDSLGVYEDDEMWMEFEDEFNEEHHTIWDPVKGMNVTFFYFNDVMILYVVRPVSKVYGFILPQFVRVGVHRFIDNLGFPRRFVNNLLQGHPCYAGVETGRFVVNSTVGVLGVWDPATKLLHWQKHNEDFDQTLGTWGMGMCFYLNWPFAGPSSLRSTLALPLDIALHPLSYHSVNTVNRASLGEIDEYKSIKTMALDPYVSIRNFYSQQRKKKVAEH